MKNGQKKAASSGGSLSAADVVPTGQLATTDYTASLQSVQDEVTGRFAPKKALGMKLSRVYELLSLYRRADRVGQCGSELEFGILPDGTKTGSFAVPWSMHVIFRVLRQRKSMYISIWDLQA